MEGVRGSSRVAVEAIMLVVILLSSSSCVKCSPFDDCCRHCVLDSCRGVATCSLGCIARCWFDTSSASLAVKDDRHSLTHYCELGCAYSLCSDIITTISSPNVEAVEECVKPCFDKICTKYHQIHP
ncbi:hypothetical protein Syun_011283 [Stephania yunnanensis]|uniref:Uncharacterized protein n=1 Tax=Stephania yunnanensis TaxID=152371 RepID=A0AAP0JX86_9MAGN